MLSASKLKFFLFITLTIFSLHLSPVANAQEAANSSNWTAPRQTGYTNETIFSDLGGCKILGKALIPGEKCPTHKQDGSVALYNQLPEGGAIGGLTSAIAFLYDNRPATSTEYLADIGSNIGIVQPAYAQIADYDPGHNVLKPVMNVWKVTRNISYLAFTLIAVAIGFMVMFRQKMNPQTVVTIQSALPGLVIGLVLVSLSYRQ